MQVFNNAMNFRRQFFLLVLGLSVALGGLFSTKASAMTVLYAELPELVRTSELVLHGKIIDVQAIDRRAEGRGVWTEFSLSVVEVWKGDRAKVGPVFKWRHVGGTTSDGTRLYVPGMPTFRVGEETVVLLERTSQGHVVCGATQGKFQVITKTIGKKSSKIAVRNVGGLHLMRRDPQGSLQTMRTSKKLGAGAGLTRPMDAPWALSELRAQVKAWVKQDSARLKLAKPHVRRHIARKPAAKVRP